MKADSSGLFSALDQVVEIESKVDKQKLLDGQHSLPSQAASHQNKLAAAIVT